MIVMDLKFSVNLNNKGLEIFYKEYQVEIFRYFLENKVGDSRRVHSYIEKTESPISRASVINSLKWFNELGFFNSKTETTKGGYKAVYTIKGSIRSLDDILRLTLKKITNAVHSEIEG